MTYPTYTQQQLRCKSLDQLKRIYSEIGCTLEVTDKRYKEEWRSAIAAYQSAQLQKVTRPATDEQAIAQGEFEQYIESQANANAPEELTVIEINPHHFEIFAGKQLIAYISYDSSEFVTQPWVVMISGNEIFRHNTLARCQRFIHWHYPMRSEVLSRKSEVTSQLPPTSDFRPPTSSQDGTLPLPLPAPAQFPEVPTITEISFYDQEASVDGQLVASVSFDQDNYQDLYWRVLVNDIEIFRDTTPERCHSYVKQHYQQGTLPVQAQFEEPFQALVQGAGCGGERRGRGAEAQRGRGESTCNSPILPCTSAPLLNSPCSFSSFLPNTNEYLQYHPLEQLSSAELQRLFKAAELVAV